MIYYLYKITNLVNKKRYIGITNNPKRRWKLHRFSRRPYPISLAIQKYGRENFEFQILVIGDEAYIKELEVKAITAFNTKAPNGYNLTDGGEGSRGSPHSKHAKTKMKMAWQSRRNDIKQLTRIKETAIKRYSDPTESKRLAEIGLLGAIATQRPVVIDGTRYESIKMAIQKLGATRNFLAYRLRSNNYPQYNYL